MKAGRKVRTIFHDEAGLLPKAQNHINMKFNYFLLAFLIVPFFSFAQLTEGEIIFRETIQLNLDLPEGDAEMFGNLPTSQSFTRSLLFNESASIYKDHDGTEDEDMEFNASNDGNEIQIKMRVPENTFYTDIEDGSSINSREFFGRLFLISGDTEKHPWKLTGKQKKVLEYVCQQAVFEDEERKVEAWFAPQIPVSAGPNEYNGLPGMVLEVSIDDGDRTIIAAKVIEKTVDEKDIEKPKKGKSISREDFNEMEEKKMKEMEEEMGGRGGRIIIRN